MSKHGTNKRKRPTMSLVMIVKDEEAVLPRALASVQDIVDEMVIVDTGSTDATIQVALDHGARVIEEPWRDDFSAVRNAGLEAATSDWILNLDADEELAAGKETLPDLLRDRDAVAYHVSIVVAADGHDVTQVLDRAVSPRIFRRRPDIRFKFPIHEVPTRPEDARAPFTELVINHFGPIIHPNRDRFSRNAPLLLKAISDFPGEARFSFYLGLEYEIRGELEPALKYFSDSLQTEDRNQVHIAAAERNVVWVLARLGRMEEAWNRLMELQRSMPRFTDLFYIEAKILATVGRLPEAAAAFERCLRMGEPPQRYWSWGGTGSWRAEADLVALRAQTPAT